MIFEWFTDMLIEVLGFGVVGCQAVGLPLQAIDTLSLFCGYGAWVVGADLMLIFASMVLFWSMVKVGLGTILFIWRLLPFT